MRIFGIPRTHIQILFTKLKERKKYPQNFLTKPTCQHTDTEDRSSSKNQGRKIFLVKQKKIKKNNIYI